MKVKDKVILILFIILVLAVIGLIGCEVLNRRALSNVNKIADTTVIDYEAYKNRVGDIALIYGIWNRNSYEEASRKCNVSSELREKLFSGYTGTNYKSQPIVTIENIQYDLGADTGGVRVYSAEMSIINSDTQDILNYNVIAYIANDTLVDYIVY